MTMNPISHEKDLGSKKEEEAADERKSFTPSSSSSRQWSSSFKNPRIVRVSRTFGGKDRHSKVCTVRGLRDRRIRLSVPTAIQLYDLQDRLGLTQPSKVIDWLIDATKHEIDKLPPLPMLPTNFLHYFHQPSSLMLANNNTIIQPHDHTYASHDHLPLLSPNDLYKERERWNMNINTSTSTTLGSSQNDDVDGEGGFGGFVSTAHNFFPLNSQFSVPNMPYNSNYFQLDSTPNLSLSQFGGGFSDHHHHQPHESNCSLSSSSSSTSQIYMCPSATSITPPPPPFAPYINAAPSQLENDHQYQFRQTNHYQNSVLMPTTLHLINSPIKSFTSLHSNPNETGKQDEDRSS